MGEGVLKKYPFDQQILPLYWCGSLSSCLWRDERDHPCRTLQERSINAFEISPEGMWVSQQKMQPLANLGLLCRVPHAYRSLLKHRLHMESITEYSLWWVVALGLAGTTAGHRGGCGGCGAQLTGAGNGKMPYWPGQSPVCIFVVFFLIPPNKEHCYYWKLSFRFFPVIFKVMVLFFPVVHLDERTTSYF